MSAPAVEVRDLFRIYATADGHAAGLQGLSILVPPGEVLVVLGPSGAGKTTLLRILAGLDRPSAGQVAVFGRDLGALRRRPLARYRADLGYLDQHYDRALFSELCARDLVALPLALRGEPAPRARERADELLERVGLGEKRGARPDELSGGEQQRVAVCAAIAHRPRLLLADEPTGELDAVNAADVFALIGDVARQEGATAIVVSHDPASSGIADRTVRIRDGRVSEESTSPRSGDGAIVVGRGGWLRLPEELLQRAGIGGRATARLAGSEIVVAPADGFASPPVTEPETAPLARAPRGLGAPVVELNGVTRTFGRGAAAATPVADANATFAAGLLHAITGPSGSGKTTVLRLVSGLDLPTAGEVRVLGTRISTLDRPARAAFRRASLAVVEQQQALVPFLSAVENVRLGLAVRGRLGPEAHRDALDALAEVGLADRAARATGELSTGERLRVAVARALAARPAVLVADEPTARLDEASALSVASLLARLARDVGIAVLCATHDPLVIEQADAELRLGRAA
jgi:ABC-type lipoprotein export system ATPase subunit